MTSAGIDGDFTACDPGVCHIFLSATSSRTSGSDLTAITPSAAAMVIAPTYPSVLIALLLLFSRSATRGIDVLVPRPVARRALLPDCRPRRRRPMRFPASAGPCATWPPCHADRSPVRCFPGRTPDRPPKAAGRGGSRARPGRRPAADSAGNLTPPGGDACRLRLALAPGPG